MIVFFDTETNGLPKNYKANAHDLDNWPRVIQLAWAITDDDGQNVIEADCNLIIPTNWEIPKEKFWIDHGYSTEDSLAKGIPIEVALQGFINAIERSHTLVAHNMDFDMKIVAAEMIRSGIKAENTPKKFCTMKASTDVCKIPGPFGFKWPKLEELHSYLFLEPFTGAHDAMNDVMACAKCFFEMRRRQLITA